MKTTIRLANERFPEPAFSLLQKSVFSQVEAESPELARVLAHEGPTAVAPSGSSSPAMVRFGAYVEEELVGWSFGWLEGGNRFYMANSGVVPERQGQGIYSALLDAVVLQAQSMGAVIVRSQHSVLNNRVMVCKLKRGFHITGLSVSAEMGSLVELVLHLSEPRMELFRHRSIPLTAPR